MSHNPSFRGDNPGMGFHQRRITTGDLMYGGLYPILTPPQEGVVLNTLPQRPPMRKEAVYTPPPQDVFCNQPTKEASCSNKTGSYDVAPLTEGEKVQRRTMKRASYRRMENLMTGLIVIVIIAVIIILGCLIPAIYFLGDSARVYRMNTENHKEIKATLNDPFKIKELETLLSGITTSAKMTKEENDRLKALARDSKMFGYCTHNVPASACLPCSCTPYNILDNEYQCDCTNLAPKKNCREYYENGFRIDGAYTLKPDGIRNVTVYCDQTKDGGGWEVIQRRVDGSTGFHRDWNEYKLGFGALHREFYLGNKYINALTKESKELLITLVDFNSQKYIARYTSFSVMNEEAKFMLNCSGYAGDKARDYFCKYHSGKPFSSHDKDNDLSVALNCAHSSEGGGGWWYTDCYEVNLNGVYHHVRLKRKDAIVWFDVDSQNSLKGTEMKIRTPRKDDISKLYNQ